MFRSLFPFRRLLATSFLLVFVNVFAGQCYCAGLRAATASPAPGKPAATPAPMQPGHACCKAAAGKGGQPTNPPAKPQHQSKHSEKGGCCKDNSAAILKSLTTPGEKLLLSPAPALLPASSDFFFQPAAGDWDRTHSVVLVLRKHLPPKIPDIRIFIQSLTV